MPQFTPGQTVEVSAAVKHRFERGVIAGIDRRDPRLPILAKFSDGRFYWYAPGELRAVRGEVTRQ